MGQCVCCARLKGRVRRSRVYRHKRFDFAPKRLWKFKDSAIRNEFQEMSLRNDDAFDDAIESLPGAAPTVVNGNTWRSGSEEEIDTGEVRMSGRLVFSEDSAEDNSATPSQVSLDGSSVAMETEEEYRGRSWSNSSEQRGRFEIPTLDEDDVLYTTDTDTQPPRQQEQSTHEETSRLITRQDNCA